MPNQGVLDVVAENTRNHSISHSKQPIVQFRNPKDIKDLFYQKQCLDPSSESKSIPSQPLYIQFQIHQFQFLQSHINLCLFSTIITTRLFQIVILKLQTSTLMEEITNTLPKSTLTQEQQIIDKISQNIDPFNLLPTEGIISENSSIVKLWKVTKKLASSSQIGQQQLQVPAKTSKTKIDEQFQKMKKTLLDTPQKIEAAEKWVGELMRISVEEAYNSYFQNGKENQMRLAFSSLIINNYRRFIIQGSKIKGLDLETIEKVFKKSSDSTIEYLQYKYQSSNSKVVDLRLGDEIKQTDNLIDSHYDMLRRSGITLPIQSEENLRFGIKQFLNRLIQESHKCSEMFKKFVTEIFDVKVNSQLHYQIGCKIKKNTKPYTEEELRDPGFFVKGNEIMRIMMKWIEELLDFFKKDTRTVNNKGGFRMNYENQMIKLNHHRKKQMWNKFKMQYEGNPRIKNGNCLKNKLLQLQKQIRSTISRIVLVSENEVDKIQFLDKNIINMLIISKHVWKGLQNYMMDVLVTIFTSFYNIKMTYEIQSQSQSDYQIHTFMLGDLLRCKCSGTREQIIKVYRNMEDRQKKGEIKIVRVKNRLNKQTTDFLINFVFQDPNRCFLICQMQIALAKNSNNDDRGYHFDHFLYEMARSPHGISVQLAVMLYTLDNRKTYMINHNLNFRENTQNFQFDQTLKQIVCTRCPENSHRLSIVADRKKSYMCNSCCKLIRSYKFFFDGFSCQTCRNSICPQCCFNILDLQASSEILLHDFEKLKKYFKPINKVYLPKQSLSQLNDIISKHLDGKQNKFLGVLHFRNHSYTIQLNIIKKIPNTNFLINTFSNQRFKVNRELADSIILLLVPRLQVDIISRSNYLDHIAMKKQIYMEISQKKGEIRNAEPLVKYQCIHTPLHQKFNPDRDCDLMVLRNEFDYRNFIVDYSVDQKIYIERDIADNKMKELVQKINKSDLQKLTLINLRDPKRLMNIDHKQNILDIEIQEAYKDQPISQKCHGTFQFLKQFTRVTNLSIYNSPLYQEHLSFPFDQILQELVIKHSMLRKQGIPNNIRYLSLVKLDFSNNRLQQAPSFEMPLLEVLDLSKNNITCLLNLSNRNLPCLKRLILRSNQINNLSILKFPKLEYLNVQDNKIIFFSNILSFQTPNLRHLNMSNNLSEIQKSILPFKNLQKLTDLILSSCNLATFELISHPNLQTLKLDNNHLTRISQLKMPKLRHLDLSFNCLTQGDNFGRLMSQTEIQTLSLIGNDIKKLPYIRPKTNPIKIRTSVLVDQQQLSTYQQLNQLHGTQQCSVCHKKIEGIVFWYNNQSKSKVCDKPQCTREAKERGENIIKIVERSICSVGGTDQ